jgi:hypothetical protein
MSYKGNTREGRYMRSLNVTFLLILSFCISGCESKKEQLDAEVRRLCAIDGGVRVFESVTLSKNEYQMLLDKYGELKIPFKKAAKSTDLFFRVSKTRYRRKGNPEMWRSEYMLVRQADGKILATTVFYSRRGGDLLGPWHDSSYGCPDAKTTPDMVKQAIKPED